MSDECHVQMSNEVTPISEDRAADMIASATRLRVAFRADEKFGIAFMIRPSDGTTTVQDVLELLADSVTRWSGQEKKDPIVILALLNMSCGTAERLEHFQHDLAGNKELALTVAATVLFLTSSSVIEPDINNSLSFIPEAAHTLH